MKNTKLLLSISLLMLSLFLVGCSSSAIQGSGDGNSAIPQFDLSGLSADELIMADSLLDEALDNEALYTYFGGIKPMSSVQMYSFPVANTDTTLYGKYEVAQNADKYYETVKKLYRVALALSAGRIKTIVIPYAIANSAQRIVQVSVVDTVLLNKTLNEDRVFWLQYGLAPGASPEGVVTFIEHTQRFNRWRGYGHLFGYPRYAVDFFVDAGISNDTSGVFVKRDFFNIPVFSSQTGRFVYAMPKGHTPSGTDSLLLNRSTKVLDEYKELRAKYVNEKQEFESLRFLKEVIEPRLKSVQW